MEILLELGIGIAMLLVIDFINNLIEYFWIAGPPDDKKDKKIRGDITSSCFLFMRFCYIIHHSFCDFIKMCIF